MIKNILALQIPSVIADSKSNFSNLEMYLADIFSDKNICPDFLFLPEVWSVGWYPKCFCDCVDDGFILDFLSDIAKKYNMNIFGGSYIRRDGTLLKNSMPVISNNGSLVGFYDKIHLYTPDGEGVLSSGVNPCIFELDGVRFGASICYDIRFPELFRSYINVSNPIDVAFNLSAWPMTRAAQYSQMAASRAIENQCYFIALSQCGEIKDGVYNAGCSCVYDSMGNLISSLDSKKGFMYFSIDTNNVSKTRDDYPNLINRKVCNFGFNVVEFSSEEIKC